MNTIPSPTPPWHRPVQSPDVQTMNGENYDNVIGLNYDTTYLDTDKPKDSNDLNVAHEATLPDGNYKRQIKRIYIPKGKENTTALWSVTGTFVGFTSLKFNTLGRAAVLEWDGAGWHLIGGNAEPIS